MGVILKQRRFLLKKKFELGDKSLKITLSSPVSNIEDEVEYENITTQILRKRSPNIIYLLITIALFAALVATISSHFLQKNGSGIDDIMVYLVLFIIFSFLLYIHYENEIKVSLVNGKVISFFANSPNENEVDDFLNLMKSEQKKYLLKHYAKNDPYLTQEQLANNLRWLWNRNIINDDELDELKNTLLQKTEEVRSVGFKFNPKDN